jgi:hypothetical protein
MLHTGAQLGGEAHPSRGGGSWISPRLLGRRVLWHGARRREDGVADARAALAAVGASALYGRARQLTLHVGGAASAHAAPAAAATASSTASSSAAPAAGAAAGARGRRHDPAGSLAGLAAIGAALRRSHAGLAIQIVLALAALATAAARAAASSAARRGPGAAAAATPAAAATRPGGSRRATRAGASRARSGAGVRAGVALREQSVRAAARARQRGAGAAPEQDREEGGAGSFHGCQVLRARRMDPPSAEADAFRTSRYFDGAPEGASAVGVRWSTVDALPLSGR